MLWVKGEREGDREREKWNEREYYVVKGERKSERVKNSHIDRLIVLKKNEKER